MRGRMSAKDDRDDWTVLVGGKEAPPLDADAPDAEKEPPPAPTGPGPVFVPAAQVLASTATPAAIVEGMFAAQQVAVIAGETSTGKTFVVLSLAASIASGNTWLGRRVQGGSFAYVGFERNDLKRRLQALEDAGASLNNLYTLDASEPISPKVSRDWGEEPSVGETFIAGRLQRLVYDLQQQGLPPLRAWCLDTVRASMSGSEDASDNVSAYQRSVRRLLAHTPEAAAILVHHSGWQDGQDKKRRERGSSAWRGNADATFYLELAHGAESDDPSAVHMVLRTLKVRDFDIGPPLRMIRKRVDILGFDTWGNPLSSCIVIPDARSKADRQAEEQAESAAVDRALDLKVLAVVRDCPGATSREKVRAYVGVIKARVDESMGRLLRDGHILDGGRGKPYTVTEAGIRLLSGGPQC